MVEEPTYMEALEIIRNYSDEMIPIPMDEQGIRTDELEVYLRDRQKQGLQMPRLLYTIPSFHNPTGATLPMHRRKHLLALAGMFDFLILEDDAYGELSFGDVPAPLKALDEQGRVIYVGSLSKVVAPGIRVGWVAASRELTEAFWWFKKDLDHSFMESTLETYLATIDWDGRMKQLRDEYRTRAEWMEEALAAHMPASATWYKPTGGYFVWLHIHGIHTGQLLKRAIGIGVSYVPGTYFFQRPERGVEYLRLSFSYLDKERMQEGVRRLGTLLSEVVKHPEMPV